MKVKQLTLKFADLPPKLRNIPTPPKQLYVLSHTNVNELFTRPSVTVIGSRKVSTYGTAVTSALTEELVKSGVVIISGLALGVDSIAHSAALRAGGQTIAVLPCGLHHIYPAQHRGLAVQILEQGGALVSEYPPEDKAAHKYRFIERNRIASGLCDALLITEAAAKSGTLHTADFALEQGKDVLAVPGNITSPTSAGTNNLIKSGASLVTSAADILHVLGIATNTDMRSAPTSHDPNEQAILSLLTAGISDGTILLQDSKLPVQLFNQTLTMLEIRGLIRPLGNNHWGL
ncbi:MAG TPA: DNA-processing protein DprA [Candidatus Saccharimonadales bacterium]|nr:DNA-processing protein DprA [Candidatus Saccharimonadales bacterium]